MNTKTWIGQGMFLIRIEYDAETLKKIGIELESALNSICKVNNTRILSYEFHPDV
jgi:hypothetical protein